jgi:hypothetical protein
MYDILSIMFIILQSQLSIKSNAAVSCYLVAPFGKEQTEDIISRNMPYVLSL